MIPLITRCATSEPNFLPRTYWIAITKDFILTKFIGTMIAGWWGENNGETWELCQNSEKIIWRKAKASILMVSAPEIMGKDNRRITKLRPFDCNERHCHLPLPNYKDLEYFSFPLESDAMDVLRLNNFFFLNQVIINVSYKSKGFYFAYSKYWDFAFLSTIPFVHLTLLPLSWFFE